MQSKRDLLNKKLFKLFKRYKKAGLTYIQIRAIDPTLASSTSARKSDLVKLGCKFSSQIEPSTGTLRFWMTSHPEGLFKDVKKKAKAVA